MVLLLSRVSVLAQTNPTGSLTGTVVDSSQAVMPNASVQVTEVSTSTTYRTDSGSDGHFVVANLPPGIYRVVVTAPGFKKASYENVTIVVGQTYDLKAVLQVGEATITVTVEAGQQVLETVQTSISSTISGAAITNIPSAATTPLWSATLLSPDIQTIGGPRQSSASGLPGGAVNVTYDGIAAQWQPGKSGDPLFTMTYPNIDNISEVNISTAAGNASQTGEGAIQVSLVSNRGTNSFHGGVWEYFRNDWLNANYYFNNLAGQPRQKVRNNLWGGRIGGPILKDKLFIFADFSDWNRPTSLTRTRTLLTPAAAQGRYTYVPVVKDSQGNDVPTLPGSTPPWVTCNGNAAAPQCTADLFQMAGGQVDSFIGQTLATLQSAVSAPGVLPTTPPSLYQQAITFNNSGKYYLQMPDVRLDWNITHNHSLEFDYHLTRFILTPDILNGGDHTFPVAPFNTNEAGYNSDRALWAWAWRWNIGPNKSNEVRMGFQSSPEWFPPTLNASIYPVATTNLGEVHIQPLLPGLLTNPWLINQPFIDNPGVEQLSDNFAWTRGRHNMSFGFTLTRALLKSVNTAPSYAQVSLGLVSSDPIAAQFNSTNLPNISSFDQTTASQIYGMLAGRITGYTGSVALDPSKRQFVTGIPQSNKYHQSDFGIYATDSWRLRPNLTFNYGLRWQYEGIPVDDLNEYFNLQGGIAGLFGVSGVNNLFKPGTLGGSEPVFVLNGGNSWYKNWHKGFAPSIGVAWQPAFQNSAVKKIFGDRGQSVFRGGYSIAYSREGLFNWVGPNNPGYTGRQFSTPVSPSGPIGPGEFAAGSLMIQNLNIPTVGQTPSAFTTSFPSDPSAGFSVNVMDPKLHMPYVQSWSFGIQRSITANMVLEVRYVGNHGVGLWQSVNLNEVNIFENNFLKEFTNAQQNLTICQATPSCAGSPSFANLGLAGQVPLPIFTASFTGSTNGSQADPNFGSGVFLSALANGLAGSAAGTLSGQAPAGGNLSFWQNLVAAGYPKNFWVANPDATGGAFLVRNGYQSTYNALVFDLRRRPSHGFSFDANYTFAKGLTDDWQRNAGSQSSDAFVTLRDPGLSKGPSPYDIRHAVKIFATYDLPFGSGHRLSSSSSIVNHLIGGWQFNAVNRWQTGRPSLLFGGLGGTVNQYDSGIILSGITAKQLQNKLGVYKTNTPAPGAVWYFPQSLLGQDGQGTNPGFLKACNTPGKECSRVFIYGPHFFRADWSIQKTTKITERVKFELRFEFLDAFNNANFLWGDAYNASGFSAGASFFSTVSGNLQNPAFGRIFTAYQDFDTTADPGGRTIQIVGRINF
jgi:hypothetical protein